MCGGALPVSTAGRGQGSRLKALHKQTRVSRDAESPGTGTAEMWLMEYESLQRQPSVDAENPCFGADSRTEPQPNVEQQSSSKEA